MDKRGYYPNKRGFTLIELLVVIAVIAVLISMLLPALQNARAQAKKVVCATQLKQLGVIWLSYANDSNDVLPLSSGGGSWNRVWDFLRDELNRIDVSDGKIFYCPDFAASAGNWHRPVSLGTHSVYNVGYDLFTNSRYFPTNDPYKDVPWQFADSDSPVSRLSWSYAFRSTPSKAMQSIIPAAKTTEREHRVRQWSDPPTRISIIPEQTPMILDTTYSTDWKFEKGNCRHLNTAKEEPYAINAVYLDGHAYGRGALEIEVLRDMGLYGGVNHSHWF